LPVQRLRIQFAKGEALKYISHLDLTRTWERVFRRARLPMSYSQGYNPRPRFQVAAALPVGVTGQAELLDVWLVEPLEPEAALARLRPALPQGLAAMSAAQVDLRAPSLQSQVCAADYWAKVSSAEPAEVIRRRVEGLLTAASVLRRRQHKGDWQTYDLRPLIQELRVKAGPPGTVELWMRLQASQEGAGRPEEVLDVLGLSLAPHTVERTALHQAAQTSLLQPELPSGAQTPEGAPNQPAPGV
jgi:radical SAM-linked protein